MKTTWEDIIASELKYIDLIGYGSILNTASHEGDTGEPDTVVVSGFKRIYNLKMAHPDLSDEKIEAIRKKYWEKYGVMSLEEARKIWDENYCALNSLYTWNSSDKVNGVVIRIPRKDFETYMKREEIYDLYTTRYNYIDPETGEITHNTHLGYILSAKEEYTIKDGYAFLPYHKFSRTGAYNFWEYFGKMFDETTFRVHKK